MQESNDRGLPAREVSAERPFADFMTKLGLTDKEWAILERRVGPGNRTTLANVAADFEVSRERIRQIQKRATDKLFRRRKRIESFLDHLESQIESQWAFSPDAKSEREVVRRLQEASRGSGWGEPNPSDVGRLVVAIRAVAGDYPSVSEDFPKLTFAVCIVEPHIRDHAPVAAAAKALEQERKEQSRNWTYEELAETVLRDAGEPLHWKTIAVRAEALGRRKEFSASSFFNVLLAFEGKFVRVDHGTYGLEAWGVQKARYYADIVAELLAASRTTMSEGELLQAVNRVRSVQPGSLSMLLDMNPRFYRSINGAYGLRAWLPERHKQTLRTPSWLVEDADSFERVGRAAERGYDVESIVERDRGSDTHV